MLITSVRTSLCDGYPSATFPRRRRPSEPFESPEKFHAKAIAEVGQWKECVEKSGEAFCLKRYNPQQLIKGMYAGFVQVWQCGVGKGIPCPLPTSPVTTPFPHRVGHLPSPAHCLPPPPPSPCTGKPSTIPCPLPHPVLPPPSRTGGPTPAHCPPSSPVQAWTDVFPRENLLFLRNEDYQAAPREHLAAVLKFLGEGRQ